MEDTPAEQASASSPDRKRASSDKAMRTTLLTLLFQVSWPKRLSKQDILDQLPFYGDNPTKALYRDLKTVTEVAVEELPEPNDTNLSDWCVTQHQKQRLALTYARHDGSSGTFALAQSLLSLDIREDEGRAFVALQEGFSPGTPYAAAVQHLLHRWKWLFSEESRRLVEQKRQRRARPVLLPLSPVVDYSQHDKIILILDKALEEHAYISFDYTPPSQSWDDPAQRFSHIEPYELEYRDGHWYFTAYVPDAGSFLDFRVDRIHPPSLTKPDPDLFTPGLRRQPGVKLQYWVSPVLARHGRVSTRLREQQVTFLEHDQGAIVEGYARSLWWAKRLLLGYGEQVKALAPDDLVQGMRETTHVMSGLYEE